MAAAIFAVSLSTSFLRYSGERSSRAATFATMSLNRSCTHGVSRVSARAALSLRTIGSGVPFGKNRPNQVLTSKSGRPCSAVLGRFGSSGERFGCRMAMPLTRIGFDQRLAGRTQRADVVIAAGDQVLHRRAAAAIRHMGHVADAERRIEQFAEQVAGRAGSRRAILHRLLVRPHIGGEFLQRIGGKVLAREQNGRLASHQPGRHEVDRKIIERGLVERLVDGVGGGSDRPSCSRRAPI